MDNIYFYAFHPERYDPRKNKPEFLVEIREALENLPLYPPKDNQAFTPLIEQLHQWAKDEPQHGLYDAEAVDYYKDFPNNYLTQDRAYFELAYTPQIRTESWYLEIIEIANYAGLIVYSDIDEGLYFPDGTSSPEWYRADLETIVENQEPTVSQDYEEVLDIIEIEKRNPTPIGKSNPYLANDEDKANIFQAIIKHKLAEYGYEPKEIFIYKDGSVVIELVWKDALLRIKFKGSYFENQLYFDHSFSMHPKNPILETYFNEFLLVIEPDHPRVPPDIKKIDRQHLKNALLNVSHSSQKLRLLKFCEQEKLAFTNPENKTLIENFYRQTHVANNLNSVTELKQSVDKYIDEVMDWLGDAQDCYAYFDRVYKDTSHPLHSYYWSSTYYVEESIVPRTWIIARYLQHPDLAKMIEKQLARLKESNMSLYDIHYERLEKIMVGYDPNFYQSSH